MDRIDVELNEKWIMIAVISQYLSLFSPEEIDSLIFCYKLIAILFTGYFMAF